MRQRLLCINNALETAPQNLTPEQLFQKLEAALLHIALLNERNLLLEEKIRLLLIKKYGSGAETLSDAQLALFELEPGVCAAEVAAEAALSPEDKALAQHLLTGAPSGKKRNRPVRAPLPQNLARKERTIHVSARDCLCSQCGEAKKLIGYETSERLAIQPVEFYVEVTRREKLACARCEEMGVSTAPVPATIIEKGILADSLVVETIVKKYCDHTPLYRQSVGVRRDAKVEVSQSTLSSSVLKAGELLLEVVGCMRANLLAGAYIQADETTVPVQSKRAKGKHHQAYLWEYSRPGDLVVYDFQMGRAREGHLTFGERGELRLRECPALLGVVKALVLESAAVALPKSGLGKACTYALKQWERLESYAGGGHGMVEIDNNWAENAMRPIALGRKNWMQIGSEKAGPKIAAILSVLETCKRLGVNGREYLLEVLPQLSYRATRPEVQGLIPLEELTPAAWQQARAKAEEIPA